MIQLQLAWFTLTHICCSTLTDGAHNLNHDPKTKFSGVSELSTLMPNTTTFIQLVQF